MLIGCLQPIQVTGLIRAYLVFSVDRITIFRVRLGPATDDLLRLGAPYTAITRVLLPKEGVAELLIVTGIGLMEQFDTRSVKHVERLPHHSWFVLIFLCLWFSDFI